MNDILNKIEYLLREITSGGDDMIPTERVSHVLRVLLAQKEMQDQGLFED